MWTSMLSWNIDRRSHKQQSPDERRTVVLMVCLLLGICVAAWPQSARTQGLEPITAAGHGGFFGQDGRQIPLTLGFVAEAQSWYRNQLLSELPEAMNRHRGLSAGRRSSVDYSAAMAFICALASAMIV
ncbi:MAG: hypothetical protein ABIU05_09720, partial [Nitrospirales bacterium]